MGSLYWWAFPTVFWVFFFSGAIFFFFYIFYAFKKLFNQSQAWSMKWECIEGKRQSSVTLRCTHNVQKHNLKLKCPFLVSHSVTDWLMKWLMLIVVLIKILTIPSAEVALPQRSHCDWECCEQQVNMFYRAERQGTPGWHVDSQQACWPRSVGRGWTFLTQRTSTTGEISLFSLSMLRWFCSVNTTLPEKCKVLKLITAFQSFPVLYNFYLNM